MANRSYPDSDSSPNSPFPRRRWLAAVWGGALLLLSSLAPRIADAQPIPPGAANNVVYVQSNDPRPNMNSILAWRQNADGSLTPLPGSPFLTRGKGFANPNQLLGPNDEDHSLIASPDRRFLFAVNSGSNTIAVFRINGDGSLVHVPGSPFLSRGVHPVSLVLTGNKLYAANMSQDPAQGPSTFPPNYIGFNVAANGSLTPILQSLVNNPIGAAPTQLLVSPNQQLLFALNLNLDFVNGILVAPSQFRIFRIQNNGLLAESPGSPNTVPAEATPIPAIPLPPVALGMALHPTRPILYTGFVGANKLGVYGYNPTLGLLGFVRAVPNSGQAICWLEINRAGNRLYSTNTADSTVSSYVMVDPLQPKEFQTLILKERGPAAPPGLPNLFSSGPYQFALDAEETHLYVVTHRVTTDPSVTAGNAIHIINIAPNGALSEPLDPIPLPIPSSARPEGVVAF